MGEFTIWGHRGAAAYAPENTLASFRLAESQGADGVEMDVHLTRDGVPVVVHDPVLERVAGERRRISDLDLEEARRLDVGAWFHPRFRGEGIPTLEEVLGELGEGMRFNIEVKGRSRGIEERVVEAVRRMGCVARAVVSSFDPLALLRVRGLEPRLPLALIFHERTFALLRVPAIWRLLGARWVHPRFTLAGAGFMGQAARAGVGVVPWTVDSLAIARRMMEMGAVGIITNRPDRMVKLLRR